jgi:hypothetical protein
MRRVFNYEFEDESEQSTISFEYGDEVEEKLAVKIEGGIPVLYGNKQTFLLLAKTFSKLSLGDYKKGFHFHINTDFDADEAEAIRIVLDNS